MDATFATEFPALLRGLSNAVLVSVVGILLGLALGAIAGAVRFARVPGVRWAVVWYVNLFRCTPLLVQIFVLFYALPEVGVRLSPFDTAWLALGLWGGAYQAEVFRAGFASVPEAEVLGARALGLPAFRTFLDVTLPLGLRHALPAATATAITQFRSSSFMIVVGYQELTYVANRIVSDTFRVFQTFGTAALMYLVVCALIGLGARRIERLVAVPGLGASQ